MKYKNLMLVLFSLILLGCAQEPDLNTHRHQIDDLSDDDKDGVINQRDLCFGTPDGVRVDTQGCADWEVKEQANVISFFFAMDQDKETVEHQSPLEELVTLLNDNPEASVVLIGDTSPEASLAYNQALAERRTHTIRDMLIREGIDRNRISEQEFSQITNLTSHLHKRKRRAIAVVMTDDMSVKPSWTIFSSEEVLTPGSLIENQTFVEIDDEK
ncbi:OmpA family protein [Vibrio maerlii]|uniref:OmpA family protein n=1 Tax=Vibrio maerlii TaxID=2231648 RepID=UPI000E3C1A6F|nr:OmpA family protein [Vibrio maerlii]